MTTKLSNEYRFLIAAACALPLVAAIALPLYFSGSPKLRATPALATATAVPVVANAVPATESAAVSATDPAIAVSTPSPTAEPQPTRQPVPNDPVLATSIESLLSDEQGVYGIVVDKPGQGTRYSSNADVPFLAASLYKLVLLADIYAKVGNGAVAMDTELPLLPEYFPGADEPPDSYFDVETAAATVPVSEALFATGAYSSNVASHALLALTDDASLEAMARDLHMTGTYFFVDPRELDGWPPRDLQDAQPEALSEAISFAEAQAVEGPLMLTTPRDMERYFKELLAGQIVNPDVSEQILDVLKQQAVDDRFPCLLPFGAEMAHKTGNLDHVVHDVGIIWNQEGPVILIAMIEDSPDDAEATLIIQRLALIAYGEEQIPSIADGFATPEISCGIVPMAEGTATTE